MPKKIDGLITTRVSKVLYVTIDRPADLNRLSPELIDHLGLLFADLREDP
jgi:enoyl-CoA hydratase/carnithine racemase